MTLLEEPALQPPKGQVSELTNRSDEQSWYYVSVAVCMVVAGVFLLLRLYTQWSIVRRMDVTDCLSPLLHCVLMLLTSRQIVLYCLSYLSPTTDLWYKWSN